MKVAIVADSHWDEHKRFDECVRLHRWIREDAERRGVTCTLHAGDVFERKSTPRERRAAFAWFQDMADLGEVVLVRGNHDALEDLPLLSRLDSAHPIIVVEDATVVEVQGALIACLAWPRKAAILAAGGHDSHDGSEAAAADALRNVLRGLGDELAAHDGPTMLLAHAMVRDSVTSTGQPLVGCDFEIGLEDLALVRAAAYFLGHVHKGQHWLIGGAPCWYPGSPRRTAFGEVEAKGYLVATFDGAKLVSVEFIEAPATPMYLVEDEWGDEGWLVGCHGMPESVAGAEMRFRYRVRRDLRHAAAAAANELADRWRAEGAVLVKLDPIVALERRTRADVIPVHAPLADKAQAFWRAKKLDLGERLTPLLAKLRRVDTADTAPRSAAMAARLDGFRIRGFGPFDREFSVDLTALAPTDRIVAVCGENGAGKTTALELALPGAMFRQTATRGSLVDLATDSDAFLEARIVSGKPWTLRHLVDKRSGKSEALVLDEHGAPVLADSKVRNFDAWAATNLPAPELFFASAFAPQGAGGFLGAKPTARKDVLLQIIGPEMQAIEEAAIGARRELGEAKTALATLEARIADEAARHTFYRTELSSREILWAQGTAIERVELAVVVAERVLVQGKADAANQAALLQSERTQLARWEEENRARDALLLTDQRRASEQSRLTLALDQARLTLADAERRAANCRAVIATAAAIREAEERLPVLRQQIADVAAQLATARGELDHWEHACAAADTRAKQAEQRRAQAEHRLQQEAEVTRAAEKVPGLKAELERAERELAYEEDQLEVARGKRVASAEGRIEELRDTLTVIRGLTPSATEAPGLAGDRLDADDEQVRLAAELPDAIRIQEGVVRDRRQLRTAAEQALRTAEKMAARDGEMKQARVDLEAARVELAAAATDRGNAQGSAKAALQKRNQLDEQLSELQSELPAVEKAAGEAANLAKAEAMLGEREQQIEATTAAIAELEKQLEALPPAVELPEASDVQGARARVEKAEQDLAAAQRALAKAEQLRDQALQSRDRVRELLAERAAAEAEVADWTRLATDLGKDGLQAMIIDAAIPEINELANDLLHTTFGPRFTLEVRTQAADAKGKRLLETLDVWVIDTGTADRKGREGAAETFSGGEKTILAEALSLALTALACRRSGVERPTLIRDESAGALSEANAPVWIAMLRRAADIIGADRVLFVNHDRQTWDLADARINVGAINDNAGTAMEAAA